jgi:uncharacterized membrane protein YhaH (DUF805 family)
MLVLAHVLIAITSLFFSGYVLVFPSKKRLHVSYGLVALTLGSGTYLVWSTGSPILSSCLTGLFYLSLIVTATAIAYRRLASSQIDK